MNLLAAVLLLVGGLVHAAPPLGLLLMNLTGGTPYIQVIVGVLSVIVALMMLLKMRSAA